jgi:hypothetical protein
MTGKAVRVELKPAEFDHAWLVAGQRVKAAIEKDIKPAWGATDLVNDNRFGLDVMAALAECAVSKHFNLYWPPAAGETNRTDVGDLIEVRSVSLPSYGLLLHKKDKANFPYVLAYPTGFDVVLLGWLYAGDGMQPKYWRKTGEDRAAYIIKQNELRPIAELEEIVADVRRMAS